MPDLPQVTISDAEFERTGWQPAQGWSGLIPGATTYDEAVAKLGQPTDTYDRLNAKSFEFLHGLIILTFMNDAPAIIVKIRVVLPNWQERNQIDSVAAASPALDLPPANIAEAKSMFGGLRLSKHDAMQALIFERPGMRIACDTNPVPEPINWIEFYTPGK